MKERDQKQLAPSSSESMHFLLILQVSFIEEPRKKWIFEEMHKNTVVICEINLMIRVLS